MSNAIATNIEVVRTTVFRWTNFVNRYIVDGGHASTASSLRYRSRSSANVVTESYRRPRSFSSAFITIQSSSPRTRTLNFFGSVPRLTAVSGNVSLLLSLILIRGGSSSRIIRSNSSIAADRRRVLSNGVSPVSSSYSSTPNEYTSLRVPKPSPATHQQDHGQRIERVDVRRIERMGDRHTRRHCGNRSADSTNCGT